MQTNCGQQRDQHANAIKWVDPCWLGWCELELLLKSPYPQADYGSMIIPDKLLSKVFGHKMYKFLQNWPPRIGIFTL